jgi:hypothetical protein
MLQQAMEAMQGAAQGGVGQGGLESLLGSYQEAVPGLNRPKMDERLEGSLDALIPDGMSVSPLAPGGAGAGSGALDPETATTVYNEALAAASGDPAAGVKPVDLHTARMVIVGRLRAAQYPPEAIQQAYDAVGAAYNAVMPENMKMLNAPLTMGGQSPLQELIGKLSGFSGSADILDEEPAGSAYGLGAGKTGMRY